MAANYLGFDFGLCRIGVAVGQTLTATAQPLTTITSKQQKPDWEAIADLIAEWRPDGLVVGIPVHMDGEELAITHAARKFSRQLHGRFHLPVYEMDERLSSQEAEQQIARQRAAGQRKKTQKGDIDKMAAQIILQNWLHQQELEKHDK